MENITLGAIASAVTIIMTIGGAIGGVIAIYKKLLANRIVALEKKVEDFDERMKKQEDESDIGKGESRLILEALLVICTGMTNPDDNKGHISEIQKKIEKYLFDVAYK